MPGLQARFPSRGHTRGKHTLMFLSLSFSLLSPLKMVIVIKRTKEETLYYIVKTAYKVRIIMKGIHLWLQGTHDTLNNSNTPVLKAIFDLRI